MFISPSPSGSSSAFTNKRLPERLRDLALRHGAGARTISSAASHLRLCAAQADWPALHGRNVLLAMGPQVDAVAACLALDGRARRLVLLPPDADAAHLDAHLADAAIDAVLTDAADRRFDGRAALVARMDEGVTHRRTARDVDTQWVLLTSGTSGPPKLVAYALAALVAPIAPTPLGAPPPVWATFYDIRRYGGLAILLRALLGPGSMVLSQAGEPLADHLARLEHAGVTHMSGTPSHWRRVLMSAHDFAPRYIRLSGEIADQALLDALARAFPHATIEHAFASTEAGVAFAVADGREGFPRTLLDRAGPVEMRVVDGSLRIRSDRTARDYLGAAGGALKDADGFVDTGDMVAFDGDRARFAGRRNGIVNVGGRKVHPEEVEAVLNRHPRVAMSKVTARKSPITGAIVTAEIVLDQAGGELIVEREIRAACRAVLEPHKAPALIRFVDALRATQAGKLARDA